MLGPKWMKRDISDCCHWSWLEVGIGRIGRGGGVLVREEREWGKTDKKTMKKKVGRVLMGWRFRDFVELGLYLLRSISDSRKVWLNFEV